MSGNFRLNWKGEEVEGIVRGRMKEALGEIGLRVEAEAKKELKPGHGVLTGTLRRSIHTAEPGYGWAGDSVEPSANSPERGGKKVLAGRRGLKMVVEVGSGLYYALLVHQGHGGFAGYHFLTNAVEKVRGKVKGIVERYR